MVHINIYEYSVYNLGEYIMNIPSAGSSKRKAMNWKPEEVRKLLRLAGTMSIEDMTKQFKGRTKSALEKKCFHHGISFKFNGARS